MVGLRLRPHDLTLGYLLLALQFHYFLVVEALQEKMFLLADSLPLGFAKLALLDLSVLDSHQFGLNLLQTL